MSADLVTGGTARAAMLRGLLLGLVLQALLIGTLQLAGPPVDTGPVALSGPPASATLLAQVER